MYARSPSSPSCPSITALTIANTTQAFLVLLDVGNTRRGWVQGKRKTHERAEGATGYDVNDTRTSQIITVASISGFNRQVTVGFAYSASKAGAILLGLSLIHISEPTRPY